MGGNDRSTFADRKMTVSDELYFSRSVISDFPVSGHVMFGNSMFISVSSG